MGELLTNINNEDKTVPEAVERAMPQIEKLAEIASDKMLMGAVILYRCRNQRQIRNSGRQRMSANLRSAIRVSDWNYCGW